MIELIGIPLLLVAFFSVSSMPLWLDFKPFNCIVCLSFWLTILAQLLLIFVPQMQSIIHIICISGICAYTAILAKKILIKGL